MKQSTLEFNQQIWGMIRASEEFGKKVTAFRMHPKTLLDIHKNHGDDYRSVFHLSVKGPGALLASIPVHEDTSLPFGQIKVSEESRF